MRKRVSQEWHEDKGSLGRLVPTGEEQRAVSEPTLGPDTGWKPMLLCPSQRVCGHRFLALGREGMAVSKVVFELRDGAWASRLCFSLSGKLCDGGTRYES